MARHLLCNNRVLVKSFFIAGVPWIALTVAVTFSFYAVVRKGLEVDPILGLFIETLMLLPITLAFLGWLAWAGQSIFLAAVQCLFSWRCLLVC